MENLPKNVISKIMFYTSHPIVDILKASSIFKALELRTGHRYHGCPYDRGDMDAYYGRGYEPHKMELNLARFIQVELDSDEELKEYEAAYFHRCSWKFVRNRVQDQIMERYGYTIELHIHPIWSLTREEQKDSDRADMEAHSDSGTGTDSD